MNTETFVARQGDILIERVATLPPELHEAKRDELGRIVLARGERHDHTHAIRNALVCAFSTLEGGEVDYFTVPAGAGGAPVLTHEYSSGDQAEHEAIALAPGDYKVTRQREYVAPEIERRVVD